MKYSLLFFITFLSAFSAAGEYTGAAKITKFSAINSSGYFVIMGEWDSTKADGCTNTSKWIVGQHANYSTPESLNSAYSAIMAAYMSNQTVELYIDGCTGSGNPMVSSIWVPSRY